MNLIHANTTIASPRRQRRHHAHHAPLTTSSGADLMPRSSLNLDDAIIVTVGDAQQPPCSCVACAYQASVVLADPPRRFAQIALSGSAPHISAL